MDLLGGDVFQFLSAGGDMATIGLLLVWARINTRLAVIETKQKMCCGN